MPIHDAYARVTPFELLLPAEGFADERFPLIQEEAEERQVDLTDPERFALKPDRLDGLNHAAKPHPTRPITQKQPQQIEVETKNVRYY